MAAAQQPNNISTQKMFYSKKFNRRRRRRRNSRDVLFQEVYSDGFLVVLSEVSFAITLDHARFADGSVADDDDLEDDNKLVLNWFELVSCCFA